MFQPTTEPLTLNERKTFGIHIAYSVIEGLLAGILLLNEFIFLKSMHGENTLLALLFQFSLMLLTFAVLFNSILKYSKNKKRLMLLTGIITRLPLVFIAFFPQNLLEYTYNQSFHYIFLGIFFLYYFSTPIIFPIINLMLKTSYRYENFGKLFSYATSINKFVVLISTFLFGVLLDYDMFAFIYVYPIMGILGILSIFLLSRISYKTVVYSAEIQSYTLHIFSSVKSMIKILKSNKKYFNFEVGFMLYGLAYNSSITIVTIFFEKDLLLNFSSNAFYKSFFNILAIIMMPFFGKIIGKINPLKFSIFTYWSLLGYLLFILLTQYFPYFIEIKGITIYATLVVAFIFFGIFTATMSLLWAIGSSYFCEPDDAAEYQAIHLTFVGVRGCIAPLFGVFLLSHFNYNSVFISAIVFLLFAIFFLHIMLKINK